MDVQRRSTPAARRVARKLSLLFTAMLALVLVSTVLSACGPDANQAAAQQNKAKLDHELAHARNDLGIPATLLKPIETQEQAIAAGANGFNYNYQNAASNYALLSAQLAGIEQTAAQTLHAQAERDLQAFTVALNALRAQGFIEANAYQTRLDQAFKDFGAAKTPGDYVLVDNVARGQTAALNSLWPAYQKLLTFKATLRTVRSVGINTSIAEAEYNDDLQAFRDAASADHYAKLVGIIDGQVNQLMADRTEALPYIGSAILDAFKARIDLLRQYGDPVDSFQAQYTADLAQFNAAHTLADYLTVAQLINKQTDAMAQPLLRGKTRSDIDTLQKLIDRTQATDQLLAYEYASGEEGIGIVQDEYNQAVASNNNDRFQTADNDIQIMLVNLRALLDDVHDTTAPGQPHAADLQLMQQYGIVSGKVSVVSLREQTARYYNNGKLEYWSYVTTGRPEKPSPPGLHYAMEKDYHIEFKSSDPPGSPLWYGPTKINYAILYANYGYFEHDAWWRLKFGPGSNLPHVDPLAFDGGSHGCINLPEENMAYVYDWTPLYTPIIVY